MKAAYAIAEVRKTTLDAEDPRHLAVPRSMTASSSSVVTRGSPGRAVADLSTGFGLGFVILRSRITFDSVRVPRGVFSFYKAVLAPLARPLAGLCRGHPRAFGGSRRCRGRLLRQVRNLL